MQIQKSQKWKLCINILFFVVFFPYFCTLIFHGLTPAYQVVESRDTIKIKVEQEIGVETVSLSDYLIGVLAANIPIEYEDEALKAQTIILRSKILNKYLEKNQYNTALNASDIGCTYYDFNTMQKLWKTEFGENYHRLQKIVAETDNIIITYEGEPIDAPFFLLSSGKTRDTVEAQLEDLYPYIMAVNCPYDACLE